MPFLRKVFQILNHLSRSATIIYSNIFLERWKLFEDEFIQYRWRGRGRRWKPKMFNFPFLILNFRMKMFFGGCKILFKTRSPTNFVSLYCLFFFILLFVLFYLHLFFFFFSMETFYILSFYFILDNVFLFKSLIFFFFFLNWKIKISTGFMLINLKT